MAEPDSADTDTRAQKFGFIHFEVEPDTAFLYLDYEFDDLIKLTDGESLQLPQKRYRLLIFGKNIPDRIFNIDVGGAKTDTIRVTSSQSGAAEENSATYAAYRWNSNLMLFSDDETLISIDQTNHFSYGSLRAKLQPGVYRVRFEHSSGRTHQAFLEVNSYQLKTYDMYFKPSQDAAKLAGFIPGASQLYKRQTFKGLSTIALIGVTTGFSLHYNSRLAEGKNEVSNVRRRYEQADTEMQALNLGNQLDDISEEVSGYKNRRNVFMIAAIVIYAANIVDAHREPKGGFVKRRTFNPYRDFSVDINSQFVEARFQINF